MVIFDLEEPSETSEQLLERLYAVGPDATPDDWLWYQVQHQMDWVEHSQYVKLQSLFEQMDVARLSPESMVCVLRMCWPCMERIPKWSDIYHKIEAELTLRGLDSEDILRGIQKYNLEG
jgi:hypothetical protein